MIKLYSYYKIRVGIPWILAVFAYFVFFNENYEKNTFFWLKSLVISFLLPYFHLWFILGFLSYIAIVWHLKENMKISNNKLLIIGMVISFILYVISKQIPFFPSKDQTLLTNILSGFLYTFRGYFLFFFIFGYILRDVEININRYHVLITCILFSANVAFYFWFVSNIFIHGLLWYVFNASLIYLIIGGIRHKIFPKIEIVEYIGRQSMGFYLWHMIPILIASKIFMTDYIYYITTTIFFLLFLIIYRILEKIEFVNIYCFGNLIAQRIDYDK